MPAASTAQRGVQPLAGRGEQRPAAGEGEQPGFPPPLPQPHVQARGAARQAVQQDAPGHRALRRSHHAHAEVAGRHHERGDPPAPAGRDAAESGRHAGEIEQQQVGVVAIAAEQHGCEEGAQRGRDAERLDIDGVGDHGERHRDQRQPHDAGGRRQHVVQPGCRPDAQIDDAGTGADQRGPVRPVARLEPPSQRADDDARDHPAQAAHDRRDPVALEGELEQVAGGHQQRDHTDAQEDPLADPALAVERGPDRGRRAGPGRRRAAVKRPPPSRRGPRRPAAPVAWPRAGRRRWRAGAPAAPAPPSAVPAGRSGRQCS